MSRKTKSVDHSMSRGANSEISVNVELDNKALRGKNNNLTQAIAKLQQDNADLQKQLVNLQEESFEIKSRYNNLKNVISKIDSTTKTCLPKLMELAESFTGIIQLCTVAININNSNRDTRTQTVKPHTVNGHILHNPTITLSRLNSDVSTTPPRLSTNKNFTNNASRAGTSRETENDRILSNTINEGECELNDDDHSFKKTNNENFKQTRCRINLEPMDLMSLQDDSDDNSDFPEEEDKEDDYSERLVTIQEEDEELISPSSRKSRNKTVLSGRFQEVKIYLNQLPHDYRNTLSGSSNLSISVSPPDRRSSYKERSSSLYGEASNSFQSHSILVNDSDNGNFMSSTPKNTMNLENNSSSLTEKTQLTSHFRSDKTSKTLYSPALSEINLSAACKSNISCGLDNSLMMEESTPVIQKRENILKNSLNSSNSSKKENLSFSLSSRITKRKTSSKDNRKIAQVILQRLSAEKRLSGSPIKKIDALIKNSPVTNVSGLENLTNSSRSQNVQNEEIENRTERKKQSEKSKKRSENVAAYLSTSKRTFSTSPKRSPRPSRAARPKLLKEPNLTKKLRRSK